jgi:hypothetical protein
MSNCEHECEYGRYQVKTKDDKALILVRDPNSTFFVPFKYIVEDVNDLGDLYMAIGSVLHEIENEQ